MPELENQSMRGEIMTDKDDFWVRYSAKVKKDIAEVSAINPNLLENKNKGEEKVLKIIIKYKDTGIQECVDISEERENDSDIKKLKVGMEVNYVRKKDLSIHPVEIVKIVNSRPLAKTLPGNWTPYPWQEGLGYLQAQCLNYPRRAGRATLAKKFLKDLVEQNEEREERKKYREKPYFLVRLDPIKGTDDGEENLEKMKFPCWVTFSYGTNGKEYIGQLITGYPARDPSSFERTFEYQLVDMMEQVPVGEACTVNRNTDLKELMKRFHIKVIKGQTQCWKIGGFNV